MPTLTAKAGWQQYITSTESVCGNNARFTDTRLSVWVVVHASRLGYSDVELLEQYPFLSPAQLLAAREYAEDHREQLDALIRQKTRN